MKEKILEILEENGYEYVNNKLITDIDSLQYMAALVALEEEFEFEFMDSLLGQDIFGNLETIYMIVNECRNLNSVHN